MTILFLSIEFNYCCGVSRHIHLLSRGLKRDGHTVILGAPGGTMVDDFLTEGMKFVPLPIFSPSINLFSILKYFYQINKMIMKYKVDIIHFHHRFPELLAIPISYIKKIPTITTCHNILLGKKNISYKSKKIIAVSDAVKCHLKEYFGVGNEKIVMIRNAPREFKKIDKAKVIQYKKDLAIFESNLVIGGFGRLHIEKGFDILIDTLKIAASNGNQIDCVIAGDGPERINLEKIAVENKLKVRFLGELQNLSLYYELCDIIVIPSRKESSSLIALEAATFKKAIIVSNVGGLKEIVVDHINGLTFESEQSLQLYEAINEYLLNEELRKHCAQSLHKLLKESYSVDKMVEKTESVYNEVLKFN